MFLVLSLRFIFFNYDGINWDERKLKLQFYFCECQEVMFDLFFFCGSFEILIEFWDCKMIYKEILIYWMFFFLVN